MRPLYALLSIFLLACAAFAQTNEQDRSWNRPVEPFRIIGNIYYVGASDITSYLITTPRGHILIDSGFIETVPQIRANIEKLGFKLSDVKILLNSHAHYDHAGGLAELKRLTGAKLLASRADAVLLAGGGRNDPNFADRFPFEPVKADEVFDDGRVVSLGGVRLAANVTPGHTRGCTTWTTTAAEGRKRFSVVFVCSTSSPGYKLIGNESYKNIVADYLGTFERLGRLKPDVYLGSHGSIFGLEDKIERLRSNPRSNPFIDPAGYRAYIAGSEKEFRKKLAAQKRPQ
jgi:metallo-beta-lactamase class B